MPQRRHQSVMVLMAARPREGEHPQHASDKPYDGCEKAPFGLLEFCTHGRLVAGADEDFVVVLGGDIPFVRDFDAQSPCGAIEASRFISDFFSSTASRSIVYFHRRPGDLTDFACPDGQR